MVTKQRPQSGRTPLELKDKGTGILYYTVGTQGFTTEGEYYIDETIVKQSYNQSVTETLEMQGKVIILRGTLLEEYLNEGFSYIDSDNASTNATRKLKEIEAAKTVVEKENEMLKAAMAEMQNKEKSATVKTKGGSNG